MSQPHTTAAGIHLRYLVFIFCMAAIMPLRSQPVRDTLLNGKNIRFNHYTLYGNPLSLGTGQPVMSIGILKNDSLRTGTWYFFYPNGQLLATGKYVNGRKQGTWTYYPRQQPGQKVKWKKNACTGSDVVFNRQNDPVIKDITDKGIELFNGRPRNGYFKTAYDR